MPVVCLKGSPAFIFTGHDDSFCRLMSSASFLPTYFLHLMHTVY